MLARGLSVLPPSPGIGRMCKATGTLERCTVLPPELFVAS